MGPDPRRSRHRAIPIAAWLPQLFAAGLLAACVATPPAPPTQLQSVAGYRVGMHLATLSRVAIVHENGQLSGKRLGLTAVDNYRSRNSLMLYGTTSQVIADSCRNPDKCAGNEDDVVAVVPARTVFRVVAIERRHRGSPEGPLDEVNVFVVAVNGDPERRLDILDLSVVTGTNDVTGIAPDPLLLEIRD